MEKKEKRFALLIDADNISAKYIKPILDELSQYGNITYKRIYGDWTSTLHASWKEELLANSITPIQQFSYTQGKNATDSAMIIDAMDILYANRVDGFCIVSSDSDFTRLASRIRETGLTVIGMGEGKTPPAFRKACDVFTNLELLIEDKEEKESKPIGRRDIEAAIHSIITDNQNSDKETTLGEIGTRLLKRYPDFDVRSYGYSLLSKFLEEFDHFRLIKDGNIVTVSLREDIDMKEQLDHYVTALVKNTGKKGLDLSDLANKIYAEYENFKVQDFGYNRFSSYVRSIPGMQLENKNNITKVTFLKK